MKTAIDTEMRVALEPGDYRRFTGWIRFGGTDGWAENASFVLLDHGGPAKQMVWRKGTWKSGFLENCMWIDGTFLDGTLACCNWQNGTFAGGAFISGYWWRGSFDGGLFEHSKWYGGRFNDGTFKYSEWHNGKWHGGFWEVSSFRMKNGRYYTADEDEWLKTGKGEGYVISKDND